MKLSRALIATAAVGLAVTLAGCGDSDSPSVSTPKAPADVGAPVPSGWQNQGRLTVGIACDYPPFGFTGIDGKNAGYDAEVARTLAAYAFGDQSKVQFTCVTPQNRIPYLQSKKIDVIISTLGYTPERDKTIDYSSPYFTSGAKLLVPADSDITDWASIKGKPVITKTGTTSSTFLTNCYPDSKQLLLDATSDAVKSLKDDRAVAFAEDSTLLLGLSLNDDSLKVVGADKAETPWGIGLRQGDSETKTWLDAVLVDLQKKDTLFTIFRSVVKDQKAQAAFATNMPRPDQNLEYSDKNTLADCS